MPNLRTNMYIVNLVLKNSIWPDDILSHLNSYDGGKSMDKSV